MGIHCSITEFVESTIRGGKEREGTRSIKVLSAALLSVQRPGFWSGHRLRVSFNALVGRVWCGCYSCSRWYVVRVVVVGAAVMLVVVQRG